MINSSLVLQFLLLIIGYLINIDCTQGSSIWSLKDSNLSYLIKKFNKHYSIYWLFDFTVYFFYFSSRSSLDLRNKMKLLSIHIIESSSISILQTILTAESYSYKKTITYSSSPLKSCKIETINMINNAFNTFFLMDSYELIINTVFWLRF